MENQKKENRSSKNNESRKFQLNNDIDPGLKTFTPPSSNFSFPSLQETGITTSNPSNANASPAQMMKNKEEKNIQMKRAPEEEHLQMKVEEKEPLQMKAPEEEIIQGKNIHHNKTPFQFKSNSNAGNQSIPEPVRMKMESSLGHDFSDVKIQENSKAKDLGALAFASGNNIHFAPGHYQPQSQKGQELLGHELTHVVQQRQGKVQGTHQDKGVLVNNDPVLEKEADELGTKAAAGQGNVKSNQLSSNANTNGETVQKKDELDVEAALKYYKNHGKGVIYSDQIAEDLYKAAGSTYKSLYESVLADKTINENFVKLVAAAQTILVVEVDGKLGKDTKGALDKFQTGGAHGLDYGKLFKDKKLEIGVAIGDEFDEEAISMISYLTKNGFNEKSKSNTKNVYAAKKSYKTPGDNTAGNIEIEVIVDITWAAKTNAKDTYADYLANKEVAIYSGHARYGTGPDFDSKESTKGNFVIGKGYDQHMNEIIKDNKNDLKSMSSSDKFDLKAYQAWFFNACSSTNYKDEIRGGYVADKSGTKKSSENLRFMGTNHSIVSNAVPLLQAIIEMKSMEEIIKIMNAYETKNRGEKQPGGYYTAD